MSFIGSKDKLKEVFVVKVHRGTVKSVTRIAVRLGIFGVILDIQCKLPIKHSEQEAISSLIRQEDSY